MESNLLIRCIESAEKWILQEANGRAETVLDAADFYEQKKTIRVDGNSSLIQHIDMSKLSKAKVLLIAIMPQGAEKTLAERLSLAIDSRIASAMLIEASFLEAEGMWEELFNRGKLIENVLIPEMDLYQLPQLMKGYQKLPYRKLFNNSLFLMSDLKSYNQDPELKKSLWATLLSEL